MNDQTAPAPAQFRDAARSPGALPAAVASRLVSGAGDIALIVDGDGVIQDIAAASQAFAGTGFRDWVGRAWDDVVTVESKPKVAEMLADADGQPRWRQINHLAPGGDIAVRYLTIGDGGGRFIAIGRDLRAQAAMQQKLLQSQQSLERDYLALRQAQARYRLLFDAAAEAVIVVDAATRRVREANPAAHRLLGVRDGALVNQAAGGIATAADRDALLAFLGAAAAGDAPDTEIGRAADGAPLRLSATPFRQDRAAFLLMRLRAAGDGTGEGETDRAAKAVIDQMPDAFVLTDGGFAILAANAAFVDLTQEPSAARLRGQPLGQWLGRPGIDLDLFASQLRDHGTIRNAATILRGSAGAQDEVELSAVRAPGDVHGFTIRAVSRRPAAAPARELDLPRSVEQLTELVGRMPLKDIVRESADLIERLCIEAALTHTADNRASAAEILGLSRQSLYSKLHRHGLGNLGSDD